MLEKKCWWSRVSYRQCCFVLQDYEYPIALVTEEFACKHIQASFSQGWFRRLSCRFLSPSTSCQKLELGLLPVPTSGFQLLLLCRMCLKAARSWGFWSPLSYNFLIAHASPAVALSIQALLRTVSVSRESVCAIQFSSYSALPLTSILSDISYLLKVF